MPSRTQKFRGRCRTHGRGKKSGRGKGKRGGTGNAGLHKHKYMYMLKYMPDHFGRHGFVRHAAAKPETIAINVGDLCERIQSFVVAGTAKPSGDAFDVDLAAAGIVKLLGGGIASKSLNIKVHSASERAVSKIEEAGGKVAVEAKPEEKPKAGAKPAQGAPPQKGQPAKGAPQAKAPAAKPAAPPPAKPAPPQKPAAEKKDAPATNAEKKPAEKKESK